MIYRVHAAHVKKEFSVNTNDDFKYLISLKKIKIRFNLLKINRDFNNQ